MYLLLLAMGLAISILGSGLYLARETRYYILFWLPLVSNCFAWLYISGWLLYLVLSPSPPPIPFYVVYPVVFFLLVTTGVVAWLYPPKCEWTKPKVIMASILSVVPLVAALVWLGPKILHTFHINLGI